MMDRVRVSVQDRQGVIPIAAGGLERLQTAGTRALGLIRERGLSRSVEIGEADVILIDDRGIGRVHAEFFGDPSATDVITFPLGNCGEILVSVETARRHAVEYGSSLERELTLYIVHGLLHLHGYEDSDPAGRAQMDHLQEELVKEVFDLRDGKECRR